MNKRQMAISIFFIAGLFSAVLLAACGAGDSASVTPTSASIDAAALMSQQCNRCHPLSRVTTKTKTVDQWKVTLDRMVKHGAKLTGPQEQALVDYLATNY